jgi:hypothetical protein
MGLAIGKDVQSYSTHLDQISNAEPAHGSVLAASGDRWASVPASSLLTVIGVGAIGKLDSIDNANWQGSALTVQHGGTGAQDADGAREALGLELGKDVQPYSDNLRALSEIREEGNGMLVVIGGSWICLSAHDAAGRLGFGKLAFGDVVSNVNWDGEPLSIQNGGTGSTEVSEARLNLGLGIGTHVQQHHANLDAWSNQHPSVIQEVAHSAIAGQAGVTIQAHSELLDQIVGQKPNKPSLLSVSKDGAVALSDQDARISLELVPGKDIQGYSPTLDGLSGAEPGKGNILVGDGETWVSTPVDEENHIEGDRVGTTDPQELTNKRLSCSNNRIDDLPAVVVVDCHTRMPFPMKLQEMRASVQEAGSGARIKVQQNGKPVGEVVIPSGEKTSKKQEQPEIQTKTLGDDAEITIEGDCQGVRVVLIGTRG